MRTFRYRGRVIRMKVYDSTLVNKLKRVRKIGQRDRTDVLNPEKTFCPGVWHGHCHDDVNPYEVLALIQCWDGPIFS